MPSGLGGLKGVSSILKSTSDLLEEEKIELRKGSGHNNPWDFDQRANREGG